MSPVFYDYLVFDGTAYIQTDIIPSSLASYLGNFGNETLTGAGAGQRMFIVPATSNQTGFIISPSSSTNTYRQFSVYYGSTATSGNKRLNWTTKQYDVFLTPSRCGYANSVVSITKGNGTPNAGLCLGQNPKSTGQAYTGKMGIFKVYGDDAKMYHRCPDSIHTHPLTPSALAHTTERRVCGAWRLINFTEILPGREHSRQQTKQTN